MTAGSGMPAALERLAPEPAASLSRATELARTAVDPRLLALVDHQIGTLLGARDPLEPSPSELSPAERACFEFTERFVVDVSGVTDADVDLLLDCMSPAETTNLIAAIYLSEYAERVRLAVGAVLGPADERRP